MRIITSMPESEVLKNFIVLEGLDGAGTTTQLKRLSQLFSINGLPCMETFEPTGGPIGLLIRSVLKGVYVMDPVTVALLFAADRKEHIYRPSDGIKARLELGDYVVCDRYLFSSLAYQSIEAGYDFVYNLNCGFPLPEYLIFLDVSPEDCLGRLNSRDNRDIYENIQFQRKVLTFYTRTLKDFNHPDMKILRVDGSRSPEEISEEIWSFTQSAPIK
jgi:dTMP kinase